MSGNCGARRAKCQTADRPTVSLRRLAVAFGVGLTACGCGRDEPARVAPTVDTRAVAAEHTRLRDRARRVFDRAEFYSPRPDSQADVPLWMAPLVVHELGDDPPPGSTAQRFGAVTVDAAGTAQIDCEQPTVYLLPSVATVGDRRYEQLTYLWFYPPSAASQSLQYRGFRMTLGGHEYAVVWEILSSDATATEVYVSKPLEQAARARHGEPLAGRAFSAELPLADRPDVLAVRAVGDGPQPMGPFVYLDAARNVTTLICRCEPSQATDFPHSTHYDLKRLDRLGELHGGERPPGNLPLPGPAGDLRKLLRLPDEL